ncbi:hypothetical protein MHTCC0001_10260 [Flavobacteriaceae bacterium MHTCC 0001]
MNTNLQKHYLFRYVDTYSSKNLKSTLDDVLSFNNVNYTLQIKNNGVKPDKEKKQEVTTKLSQNKVVIPQQDGLVILDKADIIFCKANDNYTEVFLRTNERYLVSKTLKYFEHILGAHFFVRVHKSYIVNINDIVKYVHKTKTGNILLSDGTNVLVSAAKKATLLACFR